jgi:hypothetical protein
MNRDGNVWKTGMAACLGAALLLPCRLAGQDQVTAPPIPEQELPEVLTRGPVHEAFAEPVELQNQEPVTAPVAPPPAIEEAPPVEQPAEGNVTWVPGYWAWDPDRNGYIWVSACWRSAPPGLSWVPGYWVQDESQWQWVSGFWAPAGEREIEYLPPPPSLPNPEPPGASPVNGLWVAPCWYWSAGQYVLRPGYWLNAQSDWVWEASQYVWTPRGHVFVPGHWDYALEQRGMLFAPVYFPPSYYASARPVFTPSVILDLGLLTLNLFAYPRYSHYYFGDYYDDSYIRIGIYPWCDSVRRNSWYDPLYLHHRWSSGRHDPHWEDRMRDEYQSRCRDRSERPPRTFREQRERLQRLPEQDRDHNRLAVSLAEVAARKNSTLRVRTVNPEVRRASEQQGNTTRQLQADRVRWEAKEREPRTATPRAQPVPRVTPPSAETPSDSLPPIRHGGSVLETRKPAAPVVTAPAPVETRDRSRDRARDGTVNVTPAASPPEAPHGITKRPPVTPAVTPEASQPDNSALRHGSARTRGDNEPVARPAEVPPAVRREKAPVAQPVEVPPAIRREKAPVAQPVQTPPAVRVTRPERVTLPMPPVVNPPLRTPPAVTAPPAPEAELRHRKVGKDVKDGEIMTDENGRPVDGRVR